MATNSAHLAQRRQALLLRSAQQRAAIAVHGQLLRGPFSVIDNGMHLLANLRRHPAWVIGVLAAVAMLRPRRLRAAIETARLAGRTWRMVEPIVQRLRR